MGGDDILRDEAYNAQRGPDVTGYFQGFTEEF
jgi:hypothetical protein